MIEGIKITYELADQIAVACLMDCRRLLLDSIEMAAKNYDKPSNREDLKDSYENLAAVDRVIFYLTGRWPE